MTLSFENLHRLVVKMPRSVPTWEGGGEGGRHVTLERGKRLRERGKRFGYGCL